MGVTSPDNIYVHDGSGPASLTQISQSEGTSVQAAFDKRQRYEFSWPSSTERLAQTGMVQGSVGYQIDTKTEYIYDSSNWRLATPYVEFTTSISLPNTSLQNVGTLTLNAAATTDATIATSPGAGTVRITSPGLYSVSYIGAGTNVTTGRTFADMIYVSSSKYIDFRSITAGENIIYSVGGMAIRTTVANVDILFRLYQTSGVTQTIVGSVSVVRLA